MASMPYLSAVGSLQYLALCTRPDISYTVGVLARYGSNPGMQHWKAVKHLFRYLRGTLNLKLTYRPTPSIDAPFITQLFSHFSHIYSLHSALCTLHTPRELNLQLRCFCSNAFI